jgi:hypothetical protein
VNSGLSTLQPISRPGSQATTVLRIGKPKVFQLKLTPMASLDWPPSMRMSAEFEYQLGHCAASIRFVQTMPEGASIQPSLMRLLHISSGAPGPPILTQGESRPGPADYLFSAGYRVSTGFSGFIWICSTAQW